MQKCLLVALCSAVIALLTLRYMCWKIPLAKRVFVHLKSARLDLRISTFESLLINAFQVFWGIDIAHDSRIIDIDKGNI